MPRNERRRRERARRPLPPRPTYADAAPPSAQASDEEPRRVTAASQRPSQYIARQTPYLMREMVRVAGVSGVCFGLLAVLVVIDRLQ